MRRTLFPHAAALLVLVLAGCSGDDALIPPEPPAGTVGGSVDPDVGSFTLVLADAVSPAGVLEGPFVLSGENVRWLPGSGLLAVDLRITNAGTVTHPLPVGLTFFDLLPDSVTVVDPDNGIPGSGAAIVFEFANRDLVWTPGETSLARPVHFAGAGGRALAFVARVDIGTGPLTGGIAGRVWADRDGDGVPGPDEPGLPGVAVTVASADTTAPAAADVRPFVRTVLTGDDGRYVCDGLPAAFYTVIAQQPPGALPTTATVRHVLLSELDGEVSSIDGVDFGFEPPTGPPATVPAVADATVRADLQERENDNYGCAPYVAVGSHRDGRTGHILGLVQFELPVFVRPPARVHLVMNVARFRDGVGQTYRLGVHPVLESGERTPWQEGDGSDLPDGSDCVWVDEAAGVAWVGAGDGGDANNQTRPEFGRTPAAETLVHQDTMGPGSAVRWDVTDLFARWQGGLPNYGVVIRDSWVPAEGEPVFKSLWFHARENALGDALAPRLEFTFGPDPVD